ncbi:uncharacterized protein EKO05_0000532 [Ascochyta rabiei]|uniref:Uncharacterized protein n=1 Tax=Didymella rabiei TaxID=5454 RepID=A0A163HJZ8_DIDRA|nr:uncharacterized protein EKO05_0000532 [Ascochyta rabiei]KZM25325.1 hypothetical protein ST47_g3457 [Ascochyta rabiei]UPX09851.1 hypothetical protein EKO05_0000532 [Ascochyta rabiei]
MATHERPPHFERLHGCPTPPPTASSIHAPPRFLSQANHTPPPYKRMEAPKPLHTPPLEFTPIGHNQFRFTRAQSIEQSSRPSSISGHAYAGTTPQETEYEDSSEEESEDEDEDERPVRRVEKPDFELEEVDSNDSEDENIEVVQPDHCEDAKSDRSGAALEDTGVMDRLRELHVEEGSTDEEAKERIYLRKKKRWSAGVFKRTHSQSVEGDSSYSDDDPQDDNNLEARRLRRKLRGPGPWNRRASLIFEDKGFPNTNNIEEVEEPEEGMVKHTKGPPSIPSDDAFTLDELPFWRGAYDSMDVENESE